jgi:hypothetical protein
VNFCLAEKKEVKSGSKSREKAKPSLPKEPEIVHFCLTYKKRSTEKQTQTQKRKQNQAYQRSLSRLSD